MLARTVAVLLLLCSAAQAQIYSPGAANLGGLGPICPGMGALCAPVPPIGFTGAGDIVPSAAYWYSCARAYSAAQRGTKACNVCFETAGADTACADVSSDASTGIVTIGQISGNTCGANCTVKIYYDQSGNALDATQTTVASRASIVAGAQSCGVAAGSASYLSAALGSSTTQPLTVSYVAKRTSGTGFQSVHGDNNSGSGSLAGFGNSANTIGQYAGSAVQTAAATDNAFHAVQSIFNGASSSMYVDGSSTAASPGSNFMASGDKIDLMTDGLGNPFTGSMCEVGMWPGSFSGGNQSSMNSNQHTFYGF